VATGDVAAIVAIFNSTTATGASQLGISSVTKNQLLTATVRMPVRLALGRGVNGHPISPATREKWRGILAHLYAADPGTLIPSALFSALDDPVGDGVLTSQELASITSRPGTLAETLWGAGTVITAADVVAALAS
jgi:hypothetical protein